MHHALGNLVDGAVAARRHNQVRSPVDMLARDGSRGARPRGRRHGEVVTVLLEDLYGPLQERASLMSDPARAGVEDQNGVPVSCYGIYPDFLARFPGPVSWLHCFLLHY